MCHPQFVMYLDVLTTHCACCCSNVAILSKAAALIWFMLRLTVTTRGGFDLRLIFTQSVAMLFTTTPWLL